MSFPISDFSSCKVNGPLLSHEDPNPGRPASQNGDVNHQFVQGSAKDQLMAVTKERDTSSSPVQQGNSSVSSPPSSPVEGIIKDENGKPKTYVNKDSFSEGQQGLYDKMQASFKAAHDIESNPPENMSPQDCHQLVESKKAEGRFYGKQLKASLSLNENQPVQWGNGSITDYQARVNPPS